MTKMLVLSNPRDMYKSFDSSSVSVYAVIVQSQQDISQDQFFQKTCILHNFKVSSLFDLLVNL